MEVLQPFTLALQCVITRRAQPGGRLQQTFILEGKRDRARSIYREGRLHIGFRGAMRIDTGLLHC